MTDFRFSQGGAEPHAGAGQSREALAEMAEQIRRVDDAAAQAASRVGEAAERLRAGAAGDFRSQLLADLGTSLVERVGEIHAECDRLSRMLDRATKIAGREDSPAPAPAPPTDLHAVASAPAPAAAPAPQPADLPDPFRQPERAAEPAAASIQPQPDRRRAPGQATPEGVRLAATQMAVAGSSRSEIERCLRIQFGVRDADAALDEIFGTRSSEVR